MKKVLRDFVCLDILLFVSDISNVLNGFDWMCSNLS